MCRVLLIIFISLIFVGCSTESEHVEEPLRYFDNQGGFSHGGQTIKLFRKYKFTLESYSDVLTGESQEDGSIKILPENYIIGDYEISGNILKLSYQKHTNVYVFVENSGNTFLIPSGVDYSKFNQEDFLTFPREFR